MRAIAEHAWSTADVSDTRAHVETLSPSGCSAYAPSAAQESDIRNYR